MNSIGINYTVGNCRIGEAAYIGAWAVVLDNITIGGVIRVPARR